jgi:hypothetical protein
MEHFCTNMQGFVLSKNILAQNKEFLRMKDINDQFEDSVKTQTWSSIARVLVNTFCHNLNKVDQACKGMVNYQSYTVLPYRRKI